MSWITILWSMMAALSATMAGVYLAAWLAQRNVWSYLMFALLGLSIVGIAATELWMLRAQTPQGYATALRWFQLPIWSGYLAVVGLVHLHLRPSFAWLGRVGIAMRTVALVATFGSGPNLHYAALPDLEHVTVLGERVAMASGAPNPWMLAGQGSLALLMLFILDGAISTWRRRESTRSLALAGALMLFVGLGAIQSVLVFWGFLEAPFFGTPLFVGIAIVMGAELSLALLQAARAERALRLKDAALGLSEQRLSLAAEAADVGLWSLDAASGEVWATGRAREIFSLDRDADLRLRDFLERVHDQDRPRLRQLIDESLRSGARFRTEFRVLDPDGGIHWMISLGRARETSAGGRALMGATADITARKTAEDEAQRRRAQLEELSKMATLAELSASLAHEINQPLSMILTNAEAAQTLLTQDPPNLTEIGEILADIVSADQRAAEVIRRLRALLERGEPGKDRVLLDDAIHQVLDLLRSDLDSQGVTVALNLAADLPSVQADRILIEQVLLNLLNNACDALTENIAGERHIALTTRADADGASVTITDNGPGLSDPERIFDNFYSTKPGRLGMGLAIVRSILRSHQGRVWAESAYPRGTTLGFWLPNDHGAR